MKDTYKPPRLMRAHGAAAVHVVSHRHTRCGMSSVLLREVDAQGLEPADLCGNCLVPGTRATFLRRWKERAV